MRAKPWLFAAIALLALLIAHLSDVGARDAAVMQFLANANSGTADIVERYGGADRCGDSRQGDFRHLAAALLTVETLATPRLESHARAGLAYLSALAHLPIDISIGPGRIKPSTARAALEAQSHIARDELSGPALTSTLLKTCEALRVAALIAQNTARSMGRSELDRPLVRLVAANFNGQSAGSRPLEARLSAEIYLDLVYNIYQYYRFRELRQTRIELSH